MAHEKALKFIEESKSWQSINLKVDSSEDPENLNLS